ncbi:uncharacterized protein BDR25DRAFT_87867 [Lindgomyces ingoldianus]|uniref:Uncharacterized protein n=1 Tax=Lindgomyces ingoldianus TaxID=673940 RepID=A0ACB6R964_9PLEO|nr:uncharacterized protein BDR25DRAFT_87867 [Lindgomyces ingoldianus]KAF2475691.1 hypothetical protein BDR25DRAFT_87867 [Lindgomyces ingoldianus]
MHRASSRIPSPSPSNDPSHLSRKALVLCLLLRLVTSNVSSDMPTWLQACLFLPSANDPHTQEMASPGILIPKCALHTSNSYSPRSQPAKRRVASRRTSGPMVVVDSHLLTALLTPTSNFKCLFPAPNPTTPKPGYLRVEAASPHFHLHPNYSPHYATLYGHFPLRANDPCKRPMSGFQKQMNFAGQNGVPAVWIVELLSLGRVRARMHIVWGKHTEFRIRQGLSS